MGRRVIRLTCALWAAGLAAGCASQGDLEKVQQNVQDVEKRVDVKADKALATAAGQGDRIDALTGRVAAVTDSQSKTDAAIKTQSQIIRESIRAQITSLKAMRVATETQIKRLEELLASVPEEE